MILIEIKEDQPDSDAAGTKQKTVYQESFGGCQIRWAASAGV